MGAKRKERNGDKQNLRLEYLDLKELQDNPFNYRRHPSAQQKALEDIIKEVGWAGAALFNERTNRLIDGHLRKKISKGKAPVLIGNWTEEQEKKILATLDPLAAMAEADRGQLEALLQCIQTDSGPVMQMLQDLAAENGIASLLPGQADPDAVPELADDPITQPGDLWVLGKHRLLCADAAKPEDADRLLAGAPVHLICTDPPYGVKVEPRSNNAISAGLSSFAGPRQHQKFDVKRDSKKSKPTTRKMRAKDRPLVNDFLGEEEFNRLLQVWFANIARLLQPGRSFYIWGGYANCASYPPVLKACGLYFSQSVIWVKEHPVLTRKDFMGNHEWCFYGWREGAAHKFYGPKNVGDVWVVRKINPQSMLHLTQKPSELSARAIQYSSRVGENVLDLFAGSGSTLIAAEQTGRQAFLMEIDPAYCDVIATRWEQFTGKKAKRVTAGHGDGRRM